MRFSLALCAAFVCASGAGAAELPSRSKGARPPEPKAQACEMSGEPGVLLANGTCIRISGYASTGVATRDVKR